MIKPFRLIACAIIVATITTSVALGASAAIPSTQATQTYSSHEIAFAKASTSSKTSIKKKTTAVIGQVTSIKEYVVTLKVRAGKPSKSSSSSSSVTYTTKTVTLSANSKIYKQGSSKTPSSAKFTDIKVGNYLVISYDSKGNITSTTILNGKPSNTTSKSSKSANKK